MSKKSCPILHENILIHILYECLLFTYGQDFLDTLYILPDMDPTKTPGFGSKTIVLTTIFHCIFYPIQLLYGSLLLGHTV